GASHVVAIDPEWVARAARAVLFVYELPAAPFELVDASAGYWISRAAVVPQNVIEIREPLAEIVRRGAQWRAAPLSELRDAVIRSTVDFSIVRMPKAASARPLRGRSW